MIEAINHCRGCQASNLKLFFDLGEQPFANALLDKLDKKEGRYPLSLSWCPNCFLVQLNHTADCRELFSNYVWVTGTSSTARAYAANFCEQALKRVSKGPGDLRVLEIASNDGTFLKAFKSSGCTVLGVDPAANIVAQAQASGIPTRCSFFGAQTAREVVQDFGASDVVFARNVLPHVSNTHDFVDGLRIAAGSYGLVIVEIHYSKVILEELHYDSIYHEHLCYFSLRSVSALLASHGLKIVDIGESPISGGSLVLYIRGTNAESGPAVQKYLQAEDAGHVNDLSAWDSFAAKSVAHRDRLNGIISDELAAGRKVCGYGASARSSTMLNFCRIGNVQMQCIADQSTLKQNLYTAGSHIRIVSPEEALSQKPDTILILAWNFLSEISGILKNRFHFKGKIIVPFPDPPEIRTL